MNAEMPAKNIGFSRQTLANFGFGILHSVPRICNLLEASRGHH